VPKGVGNWTRGRAASELRPGLFIREHLQEVEEDFIANMHRAYKEEIKKRNERRPKGQKLRKPTYQTFTNYVWHLANLGLLQFVREEMTDRLEEKGLAPRHYFRLATDADLENEAWLYPKLAKYKINRSKFDKNSLKT